MILLRKNINVNRRAHNFVHKNINKIRRTHNITAKEKIIFIEHIIILHRKTNITRNTQRYTA